MSEQFASAKQWFENLPSLFNPEQAGDLDAVIQWDLTGEGGGNWHLVVRGGTLDVNEGEHASPDLTMTSEVGDWLAVVNGQTNPMALFMQGKIKIQGDMQLALKLQTFL